MLALGPATGLRAADVTWTGGVNHGPNPSYWTTASNWDTAVAPTSADNAILGAEITAGSTNAYIDFPNSTTPTSVGCITLSAELTAHNQILRQSSGVVPLCVFGLNGVLVTNASLRQLQVAQNGVTAPALYLAGDGAIGCVSNILLYTGIRETNGSYGFTKTGPGYLILQTPSGNTHTGPTTISEGVIDLRLSTSRLGPGTIYLGNGTLLCGADRSGVTPQVSPIVVTGNGAIKGNGGVANSSRIFPFSGSFGGSSGSLTIDNIGVAGNTFIVRLTGGGFAFTRPIVLNSDTSSFGSGAVLQLYHAAAAGTQTFSGVISSYDTGGSVQRTGADGITIFTGDNTYQGGTLISQGTLLANNTTGSALGTGMATVTNLGVLGGNGFVASATVNKGGTISPGASASSLANLTATSLTFGEGATYRWQIGAAAGTAGVNWDLITVGSWSDLASSLNPVTIKVDSQGMTPTGWNPATARDWVVLQPSINSGFNPLNFALDTTAFSGSVQGIFSLYADGNGAVHLAYTPAADIVINVPSGTQSQAGAGYATLTGAQGVVKIGNGELVVDNPLNDYQGSTKVLAGTLSISVDANNGMGALGTSSTATYVGNTTGNSNATFNINLNGVTMSRDLVVQAGSSGVKTIGTTLTSGTASYSGDITLQDSAVLSAASGSSITFGGNFSGNGGVTLNGPGSFTLSGIGTYAGATTINTPVLALNGPAFGTNTLTVATAMTLDNTSGSDITLSSCPQNWNADFEFIGSAGLYLGNGPVTLGGNRSVTVDAGTLVVGGLIGGNGGLTKRGAGTLALTGLTASSYTGGTTNLEGVLAVNGTATLGDGTGTLALAGGNMLCTESHATAPLANPVLMTADTVLACTNQYSGTYLAFSGTFAAPGGNKLTIANKGWNTTVSGVRLQGPGNIGWPIVVGDPAHDRPAGGVTNQLQFYSPGTAPAQIVSGLISGPGWVVRGNVTPNTGGATIFTEQNTFSGPMHLIGGAIGFGADSVSSAGTVTSGPIGTALFMIGNQTAAETNMTVFAYGGPRTIENPIFLNGARNVVFEGTNNLTFTGPINAGGIGKMWTVRGTGRGILAGQITSSGGDGAPLTKAGVGTLVLSADNLFTGATTVQEGTLLANNTTGSATGPNTVAVRSGATLGGTGSVAGLVTTTGGNIAPGTSAGTLTLAGGVNLSNGGTYVWDLAANSTNNPGTDFDVLAVTGGNVVLGGTSQLLLNFTGSATAPDATNPFWQTNHSWIILTVGGSASNPGPTTFASVVNGTYSAGTFSTSADAGGSIILAFAPGGPTPPPPVLAGTIVGAGTLNPTLSWSDAVSGVKYQLQYKTNLNQAGWLVVGDVIATGATASMTHTNCTWPECYYRVIVVP
jgi:fibronectin-binding autotransporter adhesin